MTKKICIAGSGPTGITSAYVLLKKGYDVTIIDPGLKLEADRVHLTKEVPVKDNFLKEVRKHRATEAKNDRMLPQKIAFGSNFMYRNLPQTTLQQEKNIRFLSSLAMGGLSNSWGANVCAISQQDMTQWPISASDLKPYFKLIEEFVEIAGKQDAIDELYEIKLNTYESFKLGPQGQALLKQAEQHSSTLKEAGIYCGRSKLAVGPKYSTDAKGCVSCGLCMHGCAYNAIFNSANVLKDLLQHNRLQYKSGNLVLEFQESSSGVDVISQDINTKQYQSEHFDKLILASGVFSSTAIVARSLNKCDHEFTILDSQKYLFPFFSRHRSPGVMKEPGNTLAQVFIQFDKLKSTKHLVSMQLYGYNDLILDPLRGILGTWTEKIAGLAKPLLERLMIGMIYLHSDDSGKLFFKVSPTTEREKGLGFVRGSFDERSDPILKEVLTKMATFKTHFAGRPLKIGVSKNMPGLSQHFGGTLPMSKNAENYQSDALGRPMGCKNVHLVDASLFPSIPGTPTTYPLMANAARIADNLS